MAQPISVIAIVLRRGLVALQAAVNTRADPLNSARFWHLQILRDLLLNFSQAAYDCPFLLYHELCLPA